MSRSRHRRLKATEYQARAARDRLEQLATDATTRATDGAAVVRELIRELVALARGRALADVRIPTAAAEVLGSRGDKGIREIGNRAGYTVTLTRSGYALAPIARPDTDPSAPATAGDASQPTQED